MCMSTQKDRELKRISLLIGEDQYEQISKRNLNLSWLLRDLLDDFLSSNKITIEVSDEAQRLYQKIVFGTGALDREFEPYFKEALHEFLKARIETMQRLEKDVAQKANQKTDKKK